MPKVIMKLRPDIELWCGNAGFVNMEARHYKEWQKTLRNSGYKKWVNCDMRTVAAQFVPTCWIYVAEANTMIGTCAAEFGPPKGVKDIMSARIATLAVLPEHRDKGIATLLVKEVTARLHTGGYKNIYVAVQSDNISAVRVYEKCGFRRLK